MTLHPEGTRELVERAQGGDRKAFEELLRLHEERLQALVASRLGTNLRRKVSAEDIVQDTLLKALQALGSFRWQGEDSFFRWLSRIASVWAGPLNPVPTPTAPMSWTFIAHLSSRVPTAGRTP